MKILFTFLLVLVIAAAWVFYDRFTKRGTIPLDKAWRDYTTWLCAVGVVLGQFVVDGLQWVAGFWEPFRDQFGALVHAPNAGMALQIVSAFFFLVKAKGQGAPELKLPDLPK